MGVDHHERKLQRKGKGAFYGKRWTVMDSSRLYGTILCVFSGAKNRFSSYLCIGRHPKGQTIRDLPRKKSIIVNKAGYTAQDAPRLDLDLMLNASNTFLQQEL